MGILYKKLLRITVPRLMQKSCPSAIPRSGEAGKAIYCYSVYAYRAAEPFALLTDFDDQEDSVKALLWDEKSASFNTRKTIAFSELESLDLRVNFYNGLYTVEYVSFCWFIFHYFSRINNIRIFISRRNNAFRQFLFNKRMHVTAKRMALLEMIIAHQVDSKSERSLYSNSEGISELQVCSLLYSDRWFAHPNAANIRLRTKLYLDSLIAANALDFKESKYFVTGAALNQLEEYEQDNRRHRDLMSIQRRIFYLTILMALSALAEAGIIKFPLLWDLSARQNAFPTEKSLL